MKLADLESREVLLAKLAGAMKGSLAKAIRTIDALRAKKEASDVQGGAESKVAVVPAPVDSEASAPLETPVSEAPTEAPAEVVAEATPETPEA
jgi:large subunit ribosomal protein L10